MCITEYNEKTFVDGIKAEGIAEGSLEKGLTVYYNLLKRGFTKEDALAIADIPESAVKSMDVRDNLKNLYYICRYDISQLFDILNLSRIDFDVFSVILSFSDEKKICRLSQEKIAKLTHHSRQNVNSSMNKLIKMNLIISTVFKTCHGKVLSTQVNIAELNGLLKRYEKEIN